MRSRLKKIGRHAASCHSSEAVEAEKFIGGGPRIPGTREGRSRHRQRSCHYCALLPCCPVGSDARAWIGRLQSTEQQSPLVPPTFIGSSWLVNRHSFLLSTEADPPLISWSLLPHHVRCLPAILVISKLCQPTTTVLSHCSVLDTTR